MQLNQKSIDLISSFEGFRAEAYPDPGSRDGTPWTIGFGHTRGVKKGDVINRLQAEEFLRQDLGHAKSAVDRYVKVPLNVNQYGALASFVFNCGEGAFAGSTLLRKLNSGDYDAVPAQLMRWVNNDGKRMKGLVRRRAAEGALWETPLSEDLLAAETKTRPIEETKGKSPLQSTTILATAAKYITGVFVALQSLDPAVAITAIIVLTVAGGWIFRERILKAAEHGI